MENNAAQRLLNILSKAKAIADSDSSITILSMWARVLDVEGETKATQMKSVALLYELPGKIVEQIRDSGDGAADVHLRFVPSIESLVTGHRLESKAQQLAHGIQPEWLYSLELCSYQIASYRPEPVLTDDDLRTIADEIDALFDLVHETDGLPGELREFLLRHLAHMARALKEVRLVGLDHLGDASLAVLGDFALHHEHLARAAKDSGGAGERVMKWIKRAATIASLVHSVAGLPADVTAIQGGIAGLLALGPANGADD